MTVINRIFRPDFLKIKNIDWEKKIENTEFSNEGFFVLGGGQPSNWMKNLAPVHSN